MKKCFVLLLAVMFVFTGSIFAKEKVKAPVKYSSYQEAYDKKDYAAAYRMVKPFAETGNTEAIIYLGFMYEKGQGVPQDYAEAVKWYTKAAEQGEALAQNNLGLMYYEGKGILQNYVQAYMWWCLSAAQGHENAVKNRDILAEKMTPSQISEAQRLAEEWQNKLPKK